MERSTEIRADELRTMIRNGVDAVDNHIANGDIGGALTVLGILIGNAEELGMLLQCELPEAPARRSPEGG